MLAGPAAAQSTTAGADVAAPAPGGAPPPALRVCADPDNLPFSSAQGPVKGLYVELAELLGAKLGLPVHYTWWYTNNQRRAMRNSILAGTCDVMIALPADPDYRHRGVEKSLPFLDVGYALVSPQGTPLPTAQSLKSLRIAVRFGSTPHVLFSTLGGYKAAAYRTSDEVFSALAAGEADLAVLWGPVAGFENKTAHAGRWLVTPLSGHDLAGQVVVGVRTDHQALREGINRALGDLQPQIHELGAKYGFPSGQALNLELPRLTSAVPGPALAGETRKPGGVVVAGAVYKPVSGAAPGSGSAAARQHEAAAARSSAAAGTLRVAAAPTAAVKAGQSAATAAETGRVRFNDRCSHCHGSNGATPIRERDVRRLSMRYDADKWQQVARKTIHEGRPDMGMPTWKGTLNDQEIEELIAFLVTIQK